MRREDDTDKSREVSQVQERIEAWRQGRPHKASPMPEELWQDAAQLAREHGVYPICRALGLHYTKLKQRTLPANDGDEHNGGHPPFVRLNVLDPFPTATAPITVEMLHTDGAKLTLQLPTATTSQLLELAQAFWRRGP